jgi:hypothetical protein
MLTGGVSVVEWIGMDEIRDFNISFVYFVVFTRMVQSVGFKTTSGILPINVRRSAFATEVSIPDIMK